MAIDLGTSNTTRYHSVPDHADFTLPDGDWAWVALARAEASANPRYLISTGAVGGANSFNLLIDGVNWLSVQVNTASLLQVSSAPTSGTPSWIYATRRSGFLYVGYAHLAGSAVESSSQAISGTSNGSLLYIGARNDLNTARFWQGGWEQVAFISGSGLTTTQAVALANGAPLLGMPFASQIKFLLHGRTATDATIKDLVGGKIATRNGTSYGTDENDVQTPYVWAPSYIRQESSSSSSVTGTLAYTNADDTLAASGKTTVVGTLAVTNANDTVSASGTTTITGSLAVTNANDTLAASGSPVVAGSLATTNADDTLSASGAVGSAISGTLAVTNTDDTVAASGTTTVTGALAYTNAGDTLAATGSTTVTGTLAATNANDTLAASGTAGAGEVIGTLDVVNADDTVAASGTTKILGTLTYTNSNDTLSAFGTVNDGVMVESALITGIATSSGIKKPGIPENAPAWLRTTLEILEGRRGNRVTIPAAANLTFSATPTQAECEALYEYTNEIRTALSSIISRFDS